MPWPPFPVCPASPLRDRASSHRLRPHQSQAVARLAVAHLIHHRVQARHGAHKASHLTGQRTKPVDLTVSWKMERGQLPGSVCCHSNHNPKGTKHFQHLSPKQLGSWNGELCKWQLAKCVSCLPQLCWQLPMSERFNCMKAQSRSQLKV